MLISNFQFLSIFILSFVLVGVLTPLMRKVAIKKSIYDQPNSPHKSHLIPIPYLGGVSIMIGVVTVPLVSVIFSENGENKLKLLLSVLIPALLLGLVGLWDDLKGLPAYSRLLAQSVVGVAISVILISTGTLGNPTGSKILDVLLTVIWIVGICNSINFFDNIDGGAAGAVAFSSAGLTVLALYSNQHLLASLALVTAGATFGFLIWNKSPAKIYMGDAGALFLGVILATLAIRLDPITQNQIISLSIPFFLLAVPILDTSTVVISRICNGKSILQGGQDHLSHRLVNLGLSKKSTVLILWLICVFYTLVAISVSILLVNLEIIILIIGLIIWILLLAWFLKFSTVK